MRVLWGGSAAAAQGGGGGFTPSDITGLKAWYSADSGVYSDAGTTPATNGGSVAQWNDRSGNGYHLSQGTGANRPTFQSTGFSGQESVTFTAASSHSLATGTDAVDITGSVLSVFVVGRMATSTASNARLLSFLGTGQAADFTNNASWALHRISTNDQIQLVCSNGAGNAIADMTVDADHRWGGTAALGSMIAYVDNVAGTEDTVGPNPTFTIGTLTVGAGQGTFWNSPLAEVVIVAGVLSTSDRNSLDGYFTTKYGL